MKTSLFSRGRRGSQVVEFVMVAPIVITVLAGIIDTSWFLARQSAVTQAAREGARQGATWDDTQCVAEAEASALQALVLLGFTGAVAADVTGSTVTLGGQKGVQLDIELSHTGIFNYPSISLAPNYIATAVYRLEDQS